MGMDKMRVRESIALCARELVGNHYLWGAGGATPNGSDGVFYRPGSVTLHAAQTNPKDRKIFAATCSWAGKFVCAGRWKKTGGGRVAQPNDRDLINYLNKLSSQDPADWEPYFQYFSPRHGRGLKRDSSNCVG